MKMLGRHILLLSATFLWIHTAQASDGDLFDSQSFQKDDLSALPQWQNVVEKWQDEKQQLQTCDADFSQCASPQMVGWTAFLSRLKTMPFVDQLMEVNKYVNENGTKPDHKNWQSPLSTLRLGGSTYDLSILKYFMLRFVDVPVSSLRLVLANDPLSNKQELMLAAHIPEQGFKILTHTSSAFMDQSDLSFFVPVLSWNENARWLHIANQSISQEGK